MSIDGRVAYVLHPSRNCVMNRIELVPQLILRGCTSTPVPEQREERKREGKKKRKLPSPKPLSPRF